MLKQINGYSRYWIDSDTGQVFSNAKNKNMYPLKTFKKPDGYLAVTLWDDTLPNRHKKTFLVHRLVAETFLPNIKNKPTVNHIDGNKQNNNVNNLEWSTYTEQEIHSFSSGLNYARKGEEANRAILTWDDIYYIRNNYPEKTVAYLSHKFNISEPNIYSILYNNIWVDKNYKPIIKHHLSEEIVRYIRNNPHLKIKDFCVMFNLSYGTVYDIVTKRTWKGVI